MDSDVRSAPVRIGQVLMQYIDGAWYVRKDALDDHWRRATPRMVELMRQYRETELLAAKRKPWNVRATVNVRDTKVTEGGEGDKVRGEAGEGAAARG